MTQLKKIVSALHLWLGMSSGAIVLLLGLTGCILAFEVEIKSVIHPRNRQTEATAGQTLSFSQLMHTAQAYWGAEKPVSTLELYNNPAKTWHFRAFKENEKSGLWYWEEKKYYESLFIDPHSGQIMHHENSEFEFFRIILYLHWSLLLDTAIGQPMVGFATLMYVLLLLSGLYLWWPKSKKARRKRFWFRWKSGTGIKRKNYELHSILGFYMLSLGLIIALTGILWAFPWLARQVEVALNQKQQPNANIVTKPTSFPYNTAQMDPYDAILHDLKSQYPGALGYLFYFPKDSQTAQINTLVRFEKVYETIVRTYNTQTGTVMETHRFREQPTGTKFRAMYYDLHVGSILGLPGKILAFSASLISASLPLTGFFIWYNRRKGGRKNRKLTKGD